MPYQIIHGDEEFFRAEEINALKARYTQPGLGDLNWAIQDGRKITLPVLREACETMPFLADSRLVIIYDLLSRFDPSAKVDSDETAEEAIVLDPGFSKELASYLPEIPAFTFVVFCESKQLNARNPILKTAQADAHAVIKLCAPLDINALHPWIVSRITEKQRAYQESAQVDQKLSIDGDAIRALVNQVGNNLRQLDSELDKLSAFTNYGQIKVEHVHLLASENLESRIFSMVDSLGRRDRKVALHELSVLLETGAHPLYILTMIVRQFRLIIMTKELADDRRADSRQVSKELQIRDFVAEKLVQQARLYQQAELDNIYEDLVSIDQQIKTGKIEGDLALELFILDVTRSRQERNLERTLRASSSSSSSPEARSR
ncbi:MAG: DNA polymerase III subunit delta [Anaerolineae bacterium]